MYLSEDWSGEELKYFFILYVIVSGTLFFLIKIVQN